MINQTAGYCKGDLLKVNKGGYRTFTQVMDNNTTEGEYSFMDRHSPNSKAYRTPWMPVAHKIYTQKCESYKKKTGSQECPPMIIRVRETTLGNNKYNLGSRQRQYYVIQEFYDEPRQVGNVTYEYEPRSWFMKWNETPAEFFNRMYSKRDAKRRHLPPIPTSLRNEVQPKIKVSKAKGAKYSMTIDPTVPITPPPPKKGRVRKTMCKRAQTQEEITRGQAAKEATAARPNIPLGLPRKEEPYPVEGRRRGSRRLISGKEELRTAPPTPSSPMELGRRTAPATPAYSMPNTITFLLDGKRYNTGLSAMEDPVVLFDEILRQGAEWDSELLATILSKSRWDYSDLIVEDPDRLIVDPDNQLDGAAVVQIIDQEKSPDQTIPQYLMNLRVDSYKGPGSYISKFESHAGHEEQPISEGEGEEVSEGQVTPTEGFSEGEGEGESQGESEGVSEGQITPTEEISEGEGEGEGEESLDRYRGEAGQQYLQDVLRRRFA